jgi:hypothetical protein
VADERDAFRFLVSPYHPETLRYPVAGAIMMPGDRLRHALTWNVFRTLEQIAPSLWMRPLLARCDGLSDGYDSAPHTVSVSCWSRIAPTPSAMLRRGRRDPLAVDVVVETDDTVVSLITPPPSDLMGRVLSETAEGGLLDLAEATAWLAGARHAYIGVVLPVEADDDVWMARVRRRATRVNRVLQATGRGVANVRGMGPLTWMALHDVLMDAAESSFIATSERLLAMTTGKWMADRLLNRPLETQRRLA